MRWKGGKLCPDDQRECCHQRLGEDDRDLKYSNGKGRSWISEAFLKWNCHDFVTTGMWGFREESGFKQG